MEGTVVVRRSVLWVVVIVGVTCVGVLIGVMSGLAARAGIDTRYSMGGALFAGSFLLYPFLTIVGVLRAKDGPTFWRYAAAAATSWLIAFPLVYWIISQGLDKLF